MKVKVNGAEREVPAEITVAELLVRFELPAEGVAVAVNRQIVPRSRYSATPVPERAQVEILRAVGGG